jgi:hypothetical protein
MEDAIAATVIFIRPGVWRARKRARRFIRIIVPDSRNASGGPMPLTIPTEFKRSGIFKAQAAA